MDSFISKIPVEDLEKSEERREAGNLLRRMRGFIASDQREWVYWNENKKFMFRPVSAAKYAKDFLFSRADIVLLMSATILDFAVFCRSVGLSRADCECLALPSDFLIKNRPIFYRPVGSMSFHNKEATLPKIADELGRLLNVYSNQKGLIHTNSYAMNEYLVKAVTAAGHARRIITHGSGGAEAAIQRHRATGGPTVLFSPAMLEGLDLRDDLSRFQVVVKVPFLNFKDPYVAARKRRDSGWYDWQTVMRLIQATGRSVRSQTDFAESYILDQDFAAFRKRNRRLLPGWWLEAIKEPETILTTSAAVKRDAEEPQLF